jgi:hypothetical protein
MNAQTVESSIRFELRHKGRKQIQSAAAPVARTNGRVPRISKLMALAIRFDQLVRSGMVKDFADLARRGQVTRARISQISSLLLLAPDIQEELLYIARIENGRDRLCLRDLLPIAAEPDWVDQVEKWREFKSAKLASQAVPAPEPSRHQPSGAVLLRRSM